MRLSEQQLASLDRDGFLIIEGAFSEPEVESFRAATTRVLRETHEANIVERDSGAVRTAMGLHLRDDTFARLVRDPRLVEPAQQIRGESLYVQQVKVNIKAAFTGEVWQWH